MILVGVLVVIGVAFVAAWTLSTIASIIIGAVALRRSKR